MSVFCWPVPISKSFSDSRGSLGTTNPSGMVRQASAGGWSNSVVSGLCRSAVWVGGVFHWCPASRALGFPLPTSSTTSAASAGVSSTTVQQEKSTHCEQTCCCFCKWSSAGTVRGTMHSVQLDSYVYSAHKSHGPLHQLAQTCLLCLVYIPCPGPLCTSPCAGCPCSSTGCCTSDPTPSTGPLSALPPPSGGWVSGLLSSTCCGICSSAAFSWKGAQWRCTISVYNVIILVTIAAMHLSEIDCSSSTTKLSE